MTTSSENQSMPYDVNREAAIGAIFVVSGICAFVGIYAADLRILAILGLPVAMVSWLLSRARLAILTSICALAAIRFLFAAAVTHDLRMFAGFLVFIAATMVLL